MRGIRCGFEEYIFAGSKKSSGKGLEYIDQDKGDLWGA